MVRVLSLIWTLLLSLAVVAVSFFYINGDKHGFPFWFAQDKVDQFGTQTLAVNYFSIIIDVIIWWFLFSMVWLVIKNYILEVD